jgi:hypothetical protein
MSLTFNTKTYSANQYGSDSVGYNGPGHTVTAKDFLLLKRTAPKPTAVFSGVGRTTAKLSRTLALTGALTPKGDIIVEISVSAPVGVADADVDAALNDTGALLSGADFKTHVKQQKISY